MRLSKKFLDHEDSVFLGLVFLWLMLFQLSACFSSPDEKPDFCPNDEGMLANAEDQICGFRPDIQGGQDSSDDVRVPDVVEDLDSREQLDLEDSETIEDSQSSNDTTDELKGVKWERTFGGDMNDNLRDIAVTESGETYIAGDFYSDTLTVGDKKLDNAGGFDIFVIKIGPSGKVLWTRLYGTEGDNRCSDIEVDKKGAIYLGGTTKGDILGSTAAGTETENRSKDGFVAKLTPSGEQEWFKRFGGGGADYLTSLDINNNGQIGIALRTRSNDWPILDQTFDSRGFVLLRLTSKSEIEWAQGIEYQPSEGHVLGGPLIVLADSGALYFSGEVDYGDFSYQDWSVKDSSGAGGYLFKLTSQGNVSWFKLLKGSNTKPITMESTSSGGIFITGVWVQQGDSKSSISLADKEVSGPGGSRSGFVLRIDRNGKLEWGELFGGSGFDEVDGSDIDEENNIYLTGSFRSPAVRFGDMTFRKPSSARTDYFMVQYGSDGTVEDGRTLPGNSNPSKRPPVSVIATNGRDISLGGGYGDAIVMGIAF